MVFSAIFNSISVISCNGNSISVISRWPVHLSMLSRSSLNNILSKSLAAFPHNHCRNNRQQWERNESSCTDYHQSSERILAEPGIKPATSCSQVCNATNWAMGLSLKFVFRKGRKHCRKRRKCWSPLFSPQCFLKAFSSRVVLKSGFCAKYMYMYQINWLIVWYLMPLSTFHYIVVTSAPIHVVLGCLHNQHFAQFLFQVNGRFQTKSSKQ